MRYSIKIIYDTEDRQYVVFVDGMKGIEGFGQTEAEAIEDFNVILKQKLSEGETNDGRN